MTTDNDANATSSSPGDSDQPERKKTARKKAPSSKKTRTAKQSAGGEPGRKQAVKKPTNAKRKKKKAATKKTVERLDSDPADVTGAANQDDVARRERLEESEASHGGDPGVGKRIAMWSGPRNISTAMMRSWGSRNDTAVLDEPFYAHYLKATGAKHPGADEVMREHETDWRKVVQKVTGPIPGRKAIWYQKHMAHHLLPNMDRTFLQSLTNCFLIRDPGEMLTSLTKAIGVPTVMDTGLPQQIELFDRVRRETGQIPPVLDARDVLQNPRKMLGLLCDAVGVDFDEAMLSWEPGERSTDGVWAKHWYASVHASTQFHSYRPKNEPMTTVMQRVYKACCGPYQRLFGFRLR